MFDSYTSTSVPTRESSSFGMHVCLQDLSHSPQPRANLVLVPPDGPLDLLHPVVPAGKHGGCSHPSATLCRDRHVVMHRNPSCLCWQSFCINMSFNVRIVRSLILILPWSLHLRTNVSAIFLVTFISFNNPSFRGESHLCCWCCCSGRSVAASGGQARTHCVQRGVEFS